jgi:hypothetical protein
MASGRPVHPLFGGGGLKNELALKSKQMNARHGGIQETVAQGSGSSSPSGAAPVVAKPPSRPSPPPVAAAPVARPPHPLFGGGGGLSELKSAAQSMNARHGGISETKAQSGTASAPPRKAAPAPPASPPGRPPNPFGGGGMASLQDQIKAKAAKRNARVQAGDSSGTPGAAVPSPKPVAPPPPRAAAPPPPRAPLPVAAPTPPPAPKSSSPPPRAMAPSLSEQIAAKAAQRKDRLGYEDDPVAAKPQREGPRPVPAADAWMAPAEKWVSAPPAAKEEAAPVAPAAGPIKTVTKTEKQTKPTTSKRIIRRKIIKHSDGTKETITTIVDPVTGEEIQQDVTVIKPLAESTDYETTQTVTKTATPLNGSDKDQKVTTETTNYTSSERPSYMPEPIVTVRRIGGDAEEVDDTANPDTTDTAAEVAAADEEEQEKVPDDVPVKASAESVPAAEPQGETIPPPANAAGWMAPAEKYTRDAPVEASPPPPPKPPAAKPVPKPVAPPTPAPAPPQPAPVPPKPVAKAGTRGPAKVLHKAPPPAPAETPPTTRTVAGTVVTTTRTVTTTKTFIPGKQKKASIFSGPAMKHGSSKVVTTTTKSELGLREEPVTPPAAPKAKAKRGWFGRKG